MYSLSIAMLNIIKSWINKPISSKVLIAAGGTAGHIIPALMTSAKFLEKNCKVFFVTDNRFDNYKDNFLTICKNPNFYIHYIKMPAKMRVLFALFAIFNIGKLIFKNKIKIVIGFGSYVSLPSILAGWIFRAKCFIHEQNSHMGLANRISMFFSKIAMLSFSKTEGIPWILKYKAIVVGFPLRGEIKDLHYQNIIETINYEAFFRINQYTTIINIVIMGGSQGAKIFQQIIPEAINSLPANIKKIIKIYHQTTLQDIESTRLFYNKCNINCEVASFFPNMPQLMSKAFILVARSGAGTIFEIMALGTPAILIPYPFATNNHQLKNATFLRNNSAAVVIEQKEINAKKMANTMIKMLNDQANLYRLSYNAKQLCEINADIKIIHTVESICGPIGATLNIAYNNTKNIVATNVSLS